MGCREEEEEGPQTGEKVGNRSWRDPGDWLWRGAEVGALWEGTWAKVQLFPAEGMWQVPHGNGCFPWEGGTWLHGGILAGHLSPAPALPPQGPWMHPTTSLQSPEPAPDLPRLLLAVRKGKIPGELSEKHSMSWLLLISTSLTQHPGCKKSVCPASDQHAGALQGCKCCLCGAVRATPLHQAHAWVWFPTALVTWATLQPQGTGSCR